MVVKLILAHSLFTAMFICCWSSMHLNYPITTNRYRLGLGGNETDRLALLAIKAQIKQDPHQLLSSWNESIHFCLWHGVTCSLRQHQRVSMLDLQSQNFAGSISPQIGNLSFLRELYLQNNSFTHEIPSEIGHLHRLKILRLDQNLLSGPVPAKISNCINLIFIHFGDNRLVGKIPSEISTLSKLQKLVLQSNNFTGEIPPSLGNLSSLETLGATYNNLLGSIPTSLGQLKKLTRFAMDSNNLSGTIPPSFYNLSSLVIFALAINQFQGTIPSDLAKTLPNLQTFEFHTNHFTGSIPSSISNATSLVAFEVSNNKLTGQVPNLERLHNLVNFNIQFNHLGSGQQGDLRFVSDLCNATRLWRLIISSNNFGGTLPASIANLSTTLEVLIVQRNKLHGSIPAGIGNLVNLELLALGENSFTGSIPTDFGKLSMVEEIDLQVNQLSGTIPSSVGNLTKLTALGMQGNNLQGSIRVLGGCLGLQELYASQNNFSGPIPQQLLGLPSLSIYLDLSKNHFTGSLPMEVGKLNNLGSLDVSDNLLSGELPNSLGSCIHLEVLHLQGNFFKGLIPSSMISVKGIQDLDISRNNFSGEIPRFLESFTLLKNLNLSFNQFWGAVPTGGVLKNASATSIVGNTGLCGGVPNLQLAKCKSKESKGGGLSRGLKILISIVVGFALLGIAVVLYFLFLRSPRKENRETALSTSMNSVLQVSYSTLLKATNRFSSANLIGVGSFGSVYKGVLDFDGVHLVAIKVFNMLHHGASKSFLAECEALRNIRHRNLVKIITACSTVDYQGNDFKALVYELMDNGSLEEWLHSTIETKEETDVPKNLNLLQRLNITIDIACALDYLHNGCETPIVHCDLKPSNVLLDAELTGHVSDFGLARFLAKLADKASANQASSIGIKGSVGYAAPEYGMGSEVSKSGDVYSFGILLLEMFTGRRPTDHMFSDGLNLHNFVKTAFPDRVTGIADFLLQEGSIESPEQYSIKAQRVEECLSLIFKLGIACSVESPANRKDISDVASELHSIRDMLLG
ncbi:PREDICTED: probable LRR receptor-like serine/threonine-protein kinase At3g47570 [Prunus mume]|uniref:Probable LRR receptor-like serine/threonine-protein kinase At3g47570 n=1 Tax=Prunus mume TaxID=102107 RepID=A0ABM0P522_PRUMU|nr:PREDICTED: probable LRR receptor-like serine/threonine-protein kinase At3g47570 [Prunus mume]